MFSTSHMCRSTPYAGRLPSARILSPPLSHQLILHPIWVKSNTHRATTALCLWFWTFWTVLGFPSWSSKLSPWDIVWLCKAQVGVNKSLCLKVKKSPFCYRGSFNIFQVPLPEGKAYPYKGETALVRLVLASRGTTCNAPSLSRKWTSSSNLSVCSG